jgi:hypothetical protein
MFQVMKLFYVECGSQIIGLVNVKYIEVIFSSLIQETEQNHISTAGSPSEDRTRYI